MPRQSITFTSPNDKWLSTQVNSEEYGSKSEVVNDLIRKARSAQEHIEFVRARLAKAEQSGFTDLNKEQILEDIKSEAKRNGDL